MSTSKFKIIAGESLQPTDFRFNRENLSKAKEVLKMYPSNFKESSIMPLLSMAQTQSNGWLPKKAIEYVSNFIDIPEIKVLEIATFYSMYNLSPVGKFHIEVCTTTPCMLRGSDSMLNLCKRKLNLEVGEISEDGKFSLSRVECLGACVNAPIVKINENYFEDLNAESLDALIKNYQTNKKVKIGPQSKRKGSEPVK